MRTLIVGASGELGSAVARCLSRAGHDLALHAHLNTAGLNSVADEVGARQTLVADVRSEEEVRRVFRDVIAQGPLDGLVYAAGVNPIATRVAATTLSDWTSTIEVNLTGAFLCVRESLEHLRNRSDASIVIISSIFGITSPANRGAYGASKHGLAGLVQSVAKEEAQSVRINGVCPGAMWSENVRRIFSQHAKSVGITVEEYVKQRQVPAGRFLELDECASLVAYLLSPDSRFVTGELIRISGGEG